MAQDKSLDELERDVEQARARVAADIARLRAPETYETAKSGLMERALGYRDQMREQATGYGEGMMETIKAKAAANPLAVAAIGAGILWRLYKHPPITTVLVGLGVASLMRTDPDDDSMQPGKLLETASQKAIEYKDRAAAHVQELRDAALGAVEEKIEAWSGDSEQTRNAVVIGSSTDRSLRPMFGDDTEVVPYEGPSSAGASDRRDAYLLGIAALAVGGAVALARRNGAHDDEDDMEREPDVVWRHY